MPSYSILRAIPLISVMLINSNLAMAQASGDFFQFRDVSSFFDENYDRTLKPSNEMLLWDLVKDQFPGLRTIPTAKTDNGELSNAIFITDNDLSKLPTNFQLIFGLTGMALRDGIPAVPKDCDGIEGDYNTCCAVNPTISCVLNMNWQYCPNNDICTKFQRLQFRVSVYRYLSREVARQSREVTKAELSQDKLFGGSNVFIWPFTTADEGTYIATKMDYETITRLVTATSLLLDSVREANNPKLRPFDSFSCQPNLSIIAMWPNDLADFQLLDVSTGEAIDLLRPQDEVSEIFNTLQFASGMGQSIFRSVGENSNPFGGANQTLIDYLDSAPDGAPWFDCIGSGIIDNLKTLKNILNTKSTSNSFFGFIYLKTVFDEIAGGPKADSAREGELDFTSNSIFSGISRNTLVCRDECAQNSPECLPVPYISDARVRQLQLLRKELLAPQPNEITPLRLGEIFDMESDPLIGNRGSTFVAGDTILNQGLPTLMTQAESGGRMVYMEVPRSLSGSYSVLSDESFEVAFESDENSAGIYFSETSLNQRYGGAIQKVFADKDELIFTTESGCIQTPLTVPRIGDVLARVRDLYVATAGSRRGEVYSTMIFRDDHPDGGGGCEKIGAGYGAGCEPSSCPPYTFNCDRLNNNNEYESKCVTVVGVGKNQASVALQKAVAQLGYGWSCR